MAVAQKNKRKIVVHNRLFFWYVSEDFDSHPTTVNNDIQAVNIISEDKKFIGRYHISQALEAVESVRHITIIGKEFVGAEYDGKWRRFECPHWCNEGYVKPSDVREIIKWCFVPDKLVNEVDYRGISVKNEERN